MSFFKKLNTLVQAQINDLISSDDDDTMSKSRRKFLARHDIQASLTNDVVGLRQRVNDALAYEDDLQKKVDAHYREIADWDAKADQALLDEREQDARFAVGRLQQAQRELQMTESALREHRFVTQELITQVNMLEAVVEQSKRQKAEEAPDSHDETIADQLSERINQTRQKLSEMVNTRMGGKLAESAEVEAEAPMPESALYRPNEVVDEAPQPAAPRPPINRKAVDDDLTARLARLSKPAPDDKK